MARKTRTPKKAKIRTAPKGAASKEAAMEETAVADVVSEEKAVESVAPTVNAMGKRELIDRVVAASGIKKKAAKPVIEATLKELGDALSRGDNLNLQPFGKGIVKTRKDLEHAEIVELRLRRSKLAIKAAEAPDDDTPRDPLAEAAE